MADIVPPIPIDAPFGSYNWQDWYQKVRIAINDAANLKWSQFTDFTGSNLNQIQTRSHQSLQNLQGGGGGNYYHLTAAQNTSLSSGISGTVVLAKITTGGANGSLTLSNGIVTNYTAPT